MPVICRSGHLVASTLGRVGLRGLPGLASMIAACFVQVPPDSPEEAPPPPPPRVTWATAAAPPTSVVVTVPAAGLAPAVPSAPLTATPGEPTARSAPPARVDAPRAQATAEHPTPTTAARIREDLEFVISPRGVGVGDLGRLFDRNFSAIQTAAERPQIVTRAVGEFHFGFFAHESVDELRAHLAGWGMRADAATGGARREVSFRVVEAQQLVELPLTTVPSEVPPGAEWYISGVVVGRLFEARLQASASQLSGDIGAEVLGAGLSLSAYAASRSIQIEQVARGYAPSSTEIVVPSSESEIPSAYRVEGDPRVVLVRYSRVPREARRVVDCASGCRVRVTRVRFPPGDPSDGATAWDAGGGLPDIAVDWQFGNQWGRVECAPDVIGCDLRGVAIDVTALSPANPLTFTFNDGDAMNDDFAGRLQITHLRNEAGVELVETSESHVDLTLEIEALPARGAEAH